MKRKENNQKKIKKKKSDEIRDDEMDKGSKIEESSTILKEGNKMENIKIEEEKIQDNQELIQEDTPQELDTITLQDINTTSILDLFNTLLTKHLVLKYSTMEDATEIIIDLIKSIQQNKMSKLSHLVNKLQNIKISEIVKLSYNNTRKTRLIACYIIYKYLLYKLKNNELEGINLIFKEVFMRRYRDVDSHIRSISFSFLVEFIKTSPKILNRHISLLYLGMKDKVDIVRKTCFIELRKANLKIEKDKIIEILQYEKNSLIKIEGFKLLFKYFLDNEQMQIDDIFLILKDNSSILLVKNGKKETKNEIDKNASINSNTNDITSLLQKVLNTILEIDYDKYIHRIYECNLDYFSLIEIDSTWTCKCPEKCYLRIFMNKRISLPINDLYILYKNNIEHVDLILNLLFYSDISNMDILLKLLDDLYKNITLNSLYKEFDKFCKYICTLNGISDRFILKSIKDKEYRYYLIKYFDIVEYITEEDYLETQIYKILWNVVEENFLIDILNYKIKDKSEICKIILNMNEKVQGNELKDELVNIEEFYMGKDTTSTLIELLRRLIRIIRNETFLIDSSLFLYIYKFNEENILEDIVWYLYKYIDSTNIFIEMYSRSKNKINLFRSYFKYLYKIEEYTLIILDISKALSVRYKDEGIIFKECKWVLEKGPLVYKYVVPFINRMNINQCIVLEGMVENSNLKDLLGKRINKGNFYKKDTSINSMKDGDTKDGNNSINNNSSITGVTYL